MSVVKADVKSETAARQLFVHYSATTVILMHVKPATAKVSDSQKKLCEIYSSIYSSI